MADPNSPGGGNSALNPAATPFTMPSNSSKTNGSQSVVSTATPYTSGSTPQTQSENFNSTPAVHSVNSSMNGETKPEAKKVSKAEKKQNLKPLNTPTQNDGASEAEAGTELTPAQLKKQKAAEKQARRAEKVAEKGAVTQQSQDSQSHKQASGQGLTQLQTPGTPLSQRRMSIGKKEGETHHKRSPSTSIKLPVRIHGQNLAGTALPIEKSQDSKRVAMFAHLYPKERRATLSGAGKEVHPAVLALGLQLRDYVICGGNARCVATLLVFKKVIQAYTTPSGVALSRHLTTHLGHQISYLSYCRPLSISQGNSIRWLKKLISAVDPDLAETSAKQFICESIDQFIRERITFADEAIAREASSRISNGDVVLTYAKSSVVEKTLMSAHRAGKKFRVIIVDSRPLFEGRNHARSLIRAGLQVQYCLLNGLADVVEDVTKCFLGASCMLGNGRLSSRAGTAMVAMMVKDFATRIPVIVLCESVKFTGRVALDSIVMNEIGDADALVESELTNTFISPLDQTPTDSKKGSSSSDKTSGQPSKKGGGGSNTGGPSGGSTNDDESKLNDKIRKGLEGWKDQSNLFLLNLMYDVTPAEYLDMVISELGSLPPTAVPVVNGVHGDDE